MEAVQAVQPGLVIVNSLQKVHTLDGRLQHVPSIIYSAFEQICGAHRAFLFVHHERKTPGDPDFFDPDSERFSGSKGWVDSAQVGIQLRSYEDPSKAYNLRLCHHKSQESKLYRPLPLRLWDDGTHMTCPLSDELEVVVDYLKDHPAQSAKETDGNLSSMLNCSVSTAKRRRLTVEAGLFPGVGWLGETEEG